MAGGVAAVGAAKNVGALITTPIKSSSNSQQDGEGASNKTESGSEQSGRGGQQASAPKLKKDRNLEGSQNQLEGISNAQKAYRQGKRRRPIDSVKKSEQNLDNELKKIKSLKDIEDK